MSVTLRAAKGLVLAAAVFVAGTSSAQASLIHNNTGLASPHTIITFDEIVLAPQTELLNTYQSFGVVFGAGMRYDTVNYGIPNSAPANAVNFFPFENPFDLQFTSPVTAAAMIIATNDAAPNTVITALLGGIVVESFNITTSQSGGNNYFGFANIVFDQVLISNTSSGIVVDNIQVPEPASLVLLGTGLAGLVVGRRQRRRE